ncbi:MAG: bifunctional adenosylcobinamide kinase/adenosylcobinamide-phosphate guanylyltransferase [Syntrophaceae bacterium]|jgi:adenosylcobinamide kinase/adenosylcobinamide-phosphate guanylyltransferase|nr:bifunctional adenosylcobinamide kinase/adenosylcobinamide-phosphate guanylyltransferase [Syntrophaceae bacterium]
MIPDIPTNGMTLILGGARSGKSALAEKIARDSDTSVLFVATATAGDEEMALRIRRHRASRPAGWQTLEAPLDVGRSLKTAGAGVVIVDCITLLINNILLSLPENTPEDTVMEKVRAEMDDLIAAQVRLGGRWLVVSNEVGLGLVPPYPLGRLYRDALGRANQILAAAAEHVIFMVAGLPLTMK